jgi:hypothetical protein
MKKQQKKITKESVKKEKILTLAELRKKYGRTRKLRVNKEIRGEY